MWSARNKMRNNDNRASREVLSASGRTIRTVWDVLRWGRSSSVQPQLVDAASVHLPACRRLCSEAITLVALHLAIEANSIK
jgi:hypothetical protein